MIPCINQVTTLNHPFENDLEAYSQAGWKAVELWLTKLERYLQDHSVEEASGLLERHGLTAAGASFQGGLLVSAGGEREAHWGHFRRRLELLQALGVGTLVLAPDFGRESAEGGLARAIESLAEAAALARPHGVRLALEFQKTARFCASLDTAAALVAQVGAGNLGLCLDLFHYYTGPSKFEDLGYLAPENLFWVQLCDLAGTPRELAGDADRVLPGDGDFQIGPIVEQLARLGYDGHASVELMNPGLWAIPADRVADIVLRATRRALEPAAAAGVPSAPGGA